MTADEHQNSDDEKQEPKKDSYKLSLWEDFIIILVAILIVKLVFNWLFGPA